MTGRKNNTFSLQVGWRREISVCVKIKAWKISISWPGDSMVKCFSTHLSWTNVFFTSLLISTWSRRVHSQGESRDMFCPRTPFPGDLLSRKSFLSCPVCMYFVCLFSNPHDFSSLPCRHHLHHHPHLSLLTTFSCWRERSCSHEEHEKEKKSLSLITWHLRRDVDLCLPWYSNILWFP